MLHGVTIQIKIKGEATYNSFGEAIAAESWENVADVLVGLPTTEDMPAHGELLGRRVDYVLGIPKGDGHVWEDAEVILPAPFAGRYRTVGFPVAGIEDMIPLRWNKKVKVERIE